MKRFLLLSILAMAGVAPLSAQIDALNGVCLTGGRSAVTQGLNSSNKLLGIIPSCTVTVYLTGTTTLATIYSNATGSVLANPFTADNLSAAAPGKWLFFAATGVGYDVTMSGGIPPLTYLLPVTLTDLKVGGGGGGSGVTNVSCSDPNPIYGCTVTNPATTPLLSFPLKNQAANTIFGNFNSTTGPPFFAGFTCTGLLTCVYNSGTNTWNVNIPSTSTLSVTTTDPVKVNGGNGPVASGTANISCPGCAQSILPLLTPPVAGNFVILRPTSNTPTSSGACTASGTPPEFPVSDNNSALLGLIPQGGPFPPSNCQVIWHFAGALAAQYPSIPAGNVTAVYATANTSWSDGVGSPTISINAGSFGQNPTQPSWPLQQSTSGSTGISGAGLETATITALLSRSGTPSGLISKFTINSPALFVYYTGSPAPVTNAIYLAPPLTKTIDANGNQVVGVDPNFPQKLTPQTLAQALAGFGPPAGRGGYHLTDYRRRECD